MLVHEQGYILIVTKPRVNVGRRAGREASAREGHQLTAPFIPQSDVMEHTATFLKAGVSEAV